MGMSIDYGAYTRDSIEASLTQHWQAHRIIAWRRTENSAGYTITLHGGSQIETRGLRETQVFVVALWSAAWAPSDGWANDVIKPLAAGVQAAREALSGPGQGPALALYGLARTVAQLLGQDFTIPRAPLPEELQNDLKDALDEADEALGGDSNDAEHDALYSIRETLARILGIDYDAPSPDYDGDEDDDSDA